MQQGRKIHFCLPTVLRIKFLLEDLLGISVSRQKDFVSVELIKALLLCAQLKNLEEIAEIEKACATGYQMHVAAMKMAMPVCLGTNHCRSY
jgi:Xaa-Pro aminopeptidase